MPASFIIKRYPVSKLNTSPDENDISDDDTYVQSPVIYHHEELYYDDSDTSGLSTVDEDDSEHTNLTSISASEGHTMILDDMGVRNDSSMTVTMSATTTEETLILGSACTLSPTNTIESLSSSLSSEKIWSPTLRLKRKSSPGVYSGENADAVEVDEAVDDTCRTSNSIYSKSSIDSANNAKIDQDSVSKPKTKRPRLSVLVNASMTSNVASTQLIVSSTKDFLLRYGQFTFDFSITLTFSEVSRFSDQYSQQRAIYLALKRLVPRDVAIKASELYDLMVLKSLTTVKIGNRERFDQDVLWEGLFAFVVHDEQDEPRKQGVHRMTLAIQELMRKEFTVGAIKLDTAISKGSRYYFVH